MEKQDRKEVGLLSLGAAETLHYQGLWGPMEISGITVSFPRGWDEAMEILTPISCSRGHPGAPSGPPWAHEDMGRQSVFQQ